MAQAQISPGAARRLVAAPPAMTLGPEESRLFPNESEPGRRLPHAEVLKLQALPSPFYAEFAASLGARLASRFSIPLEAAEALSREPAVQLTFIFLDRLARLKRAVEGLPAGLVVPEPAGYSLPSRLDLFRSQAAGSAAFNQGLTCLLSGVFGLPAARQGRALPESPAGAAVGNFNFTQPTLLQRARWKASGVLSRRFGRTPSLGLAYARSCFIDAGLIGPGALADLHGQLPYAVSPVDEGLRELLLPEALAACRASFEALVSDWGLTREQARRAFEAFTRWVTACYPSSCLEDVPVHYPACAARLRRFAGRALLFSETGDTHTAYMLAAARVLRLARVGVQHGAHYGFCDAPALIELEFAHCDRFVTWGSTRLPDHPLCRRVEPVPLPSPWLSERCAQWTRTLGASSVDGSREFDVILATDRLQRFPPTLSTLRLSRIDYLPEIADWLEGVVDGLARQGARVLHKPFNGASAELVSGAVAGLRGRWGGRYSVYDRLDKGMTPALLRAGRLVVWDEPGTGLFECLLAGIPTMLYWPRTYSREAPHAEPAFAELERVGVAHRSLESFLNEAAALRASPRAWMDEPGRRKTVREVCRELAWTEEDWPRRWRDFLRTL